MHSAEKITGAPQDPGSAEVGLWLLWIAVHLMHELLVVLESLSRKYLIPKFIWRETLKAEAHIHLDV